MACMSASKNSPLDRKLYANPQEHELRIDRAQIIMSRPLFLVRIGKAESE